MTRQQMWTAILRVSAAIDRQVAAASAGVSVPASSIAGPARARPPRLETAWRVLETGARDVASGGGLRVIDEAAELERGGGLTVELRQQVRAELVTLWAELEDLPGFGAIRKALLIYFDERIMTALPERQRPSWSLLQTEHTQSTAGGDDFYRFIDAALDDPKTPSPVFEIDYFCLRHGFRGRYGQDLAQIDAYEQRLRQRIEQPPPTAARADVVETEQPAKPWPVWIYYLLAVVFVLVSCVLMTALTNYEPRSERDARGVGRRAS